MLKNKFDIIRNLEPETNIHVPVTSIDEKRGKLATSLLKLVKNVLDIGKRKGVKT